jgi:hypothetical protein
MRHIDLINVLCIVSPVLIVSNIHIVSVCQTLNPYHRHPAQGRVHFLIYNNPNTNTNPNSNSNTNPRLASLAARCAGKKTLTLNLSPSARPLPPNLTLTYSNLTAECAAHCAINVFLARYAASPSNVPHLRCVCWPHLVCPGHEGIKTVLMILYNSHIILALRVDTHIPQSLGSSALMDIDRPGPARNPDGTFKEASEMGWDYSPTTEEPVLRFKRKHSTSEPSDSETERSCGPKRLRKQVCYFASSSLSITSCRPPMMRRHTARPPTGTETVMVTWRMMTLTVVKMTRT